MKRLSGHGLYQEPENPVSARTGGWCYAFIHFVTETVCFAWLYSRVPGAPDSWWLMALLYDALAFVPQSFLGLLADRYPLLPCGPSGLLLLLAAVLLPGRRLSFALLTAGNCLVHVAGAQLTLRGAEGRMGPSGIFVGGGSFGVIAGRMLGSAGPACLTQLLFGLLMTAMALAFPLDRRADKTAATGFAADNRRLGTDPLLLIVFFTVAARSYVGYAIPTGWIRETWQTVLLFSVMGAGKMLGGVLADRFGARRTAVVSLLAALPFLLLGGRLMTVSLTGVLLFSMTMSVSLGILVSRFPESPCLCFGLTTTALFAGTLPVFLFTAEGFAAQALTVGILTPAAALGFLAAGKKERT